MRSPERREVIRLLGACNGSGSANKWPGGQRRSWRDYRRSHTGIGLGDYLIAATALTEGLELATLNIRHYPMFPDLAGPFPT
jgi:hypothetical protein